MELVNDAMEVDPQEQESDMECDDAAAAVEKKTKEKKDKRVASKATKAPFKPPRLAEALGNPPADEAGDETAADETADEAGEAGAGGGVDPVGSQTSKSGGKGRKEATSPTYKKMICASGTKNTLSSMTKLTRSTA